MDEISEDVRGIQCKQKTLFNRATEKVPYEIKPHENVILSQKNCNKMLLLNWLAEATTDFELLKMQITQEIIWHFDVHHSRCCHIKWF